MWLIHKICENLTNALKALIYELFLKTFYEKKKKLTFLTTFYNSHSDIKILIKFSINKCPKILRDP